MLERIGMTIIMVGAMCADSECLLIPLGIVLVGIALVRIGSRGGRHEAD